MSNVKSNVKLNLLIMGPQGVGKGTQASLIADKYGIHATSVGDVLRYNVKKGTALGKKVKDIIDAGELVSDDITKELVRDALSLRGANEEGFILDGYPRNHNQLIDLFATLDELGIELDGVVLLTADHDVLMDRLIKRAEVENREDDTQEAIAKRLSIFDTETAPLINEFRSRGLLISVDGTGSIEDVSNAIFAELDAL